MSLSNNWKAVSAKRVLSSLLKIGWEKRFGRNGSHKVLIKSGWNNFVFSFHDNEEIGPAALSRIAKKTGLSTNDL